MDVSFSTLDPSVLQRRLTPRYVYFLVVRHGKGRQKRFREGNVQPLFRNRNRLQ